MKLKVRVTIILLMCLFFQSVANTIIADDTYIYTSDESININVYSNVAPSVVIVTADVKEGASSGSGIIINSNGLILTSRHVVGNAKQANIVTPSGKRYKGDVLYTTTKNDDLALVKVTFAEDIKPVILGDSSKLRVGQKVLAIGNPFGFERSLTTGIVSRIDCERQRIQTDAAINPGSSGGPLLNSKGDVIGINQSIYNPDNNKTNLGISFAVPVNTAKKLINDYIAGTLNYTQDNQNCQDLNGYKDVGTSENIK